MKYFGCIIEFLAGITVGVIGIILIIDIGVAIGIVTCLIAIGLLVLSYRDWESKQGVK